MLTPADLNLNDVRRTTRSTDDPAEYPETDDRPADEYAKYTHALWDQQETGLEQLHRTWTQNVLFLAGFQWWKFDRASGTFRPERVPSWRERPVTNLMVPFFKHYVSKLTKNKPAFTAVPASTDPEDIYSANVGDDALRAKWQELRMSRMVRRSASWLCPTGNAFLLPYWNTETGKLSPLTVQVQAAKHDEMGQMVLDEMGEPVIEQIEVPCDENGEPILNPENGAYDTEAEPAWVDDGDIGAKVLSPFQVRVDVGAETDEDVTVVMIAEVLPLRDIKRRWPGIDVQGTEELGLMGHYDSLVSGIGVSSSSSLTDVGTGSSGADTHLTSGGADRGSEVEKVLQIRYFQKPDREYPRGRHWIVIGDETPEPPGPLPDGLWPPIIHVKDTEVAGRYHGTSAFEASVGLNREYNEVNALIKEHHNLMLRGKWLVPLGSGIQRGMITHRPGEVVQHTPGLAPKMADLKPLPQQVYSERERILADFERITGIHKISMGEAPPGVTSGRAFLTLQEADDTDYGPVLAELEEGIAELAWRFIQLMQAYYDEERLIYIVGQDRRYQVSSFKGADLSGIVDVVPQAGSAAPWSHVAKQNMLLEIVQTPVGQSLFMDPQTGTFDKRRFAQLLPVAGLDSLYEFEDVDHNEAQREEEVFQTFTGEPDSEDMDAALAMGEEPQNPAEVLPRVLPWQNHAVHLQNHERKLKSASFKKWSMVAQQAFVNHWMETRAAIDEQMARQLAIQAQAEAQARPPVAPPASAGAKSTEPDEEQED